RRQVGPLHAIAPGPAQAIVSIRDPHLAAWLDPGHPASEPAPAACSSRRDAGAAHRLCALPTRTEPIRQVELEAVTPRESALVFRAPPCISDANAVPWLANGAGSAFS